MKTKIFNSALTLAVFMLASCSAGLQVSNTSSWDDEIYGNTKKKITNTEFDNIQHTAPSEKQLKLSKMDAKYSEALKALEDSSKSDTILYKAEDANPYRRILSNSYQESYERRLRGFEDPRYGLENWSIYYSDDWRYAQAYDPSYYRVVVMGSNVWVEPWYIYNSFGWPRSRFYFGFGFGWGYNPWSSNFLGYYWDLWNYNPWYYSPYVASNLYWNGWYDATYYWNKYTPNSSRYYYGRRGTNTTNNTEGYIGRSNYSTMPSDGQVVTTRRTRTDVAADTNPIVNTRETQTRVTPTYETRRGEGRTTAGDQILVRREHNSTTTRVNQEGGEYTPTRTNRPSREIGISEPTRRSTTATYEPPRFGTGTEFNNTRRVERTGSNSTISREPTSSIPSRSTTPTYNRPSRVSTPSTSQPSTRNNNYDRPRSSSSSSSSSGSSVSRSSSSSSSNSASSSSSSSSGSSTTTRRR